MVLKQAEMDLPFLIYYLQMILCCYVEHLKRNVHLYSLFSNSMNKLQVSPSTFKSPLSLMVKELVKRSKKKLGHILGIHKVGGFGRYLGLPEFIGRNRTNAFSYLAQRINQKNG